HRFDDKNKRFAILKEAMENAEQSIYLMVHEVSIQDQQHGKYGLGDPSPEEQLTLNSDQLNVLEIIVCEKLNIWAKKGDLEDNQNLVQILFDWRNWEPENTQNFVIDMVKTNEGLVKFVTSFLNKSESYTISDKVSRPKWTMNINNIGEFLDLDKTKERIETIKLLNDFESMDKNEKRAINLFLEQMEKQNISTE
ncbi:MAG: hypothetical protein ABFD07_04865, partial [Methanobacterium sp.]